MKKFIALILALISLFALASCAEKTPDTPCMLEVDCTEAIESGKLSNAELSYLPDDGKVIAKREVLFAEGETVFDVLIRELQKDNIHYDFSTGSSKKNKYIRAIANLYRLEPDDYSGWSYYVNGELPTTAASEYKLTEGDEILFIFIEDFTKAE